MAGLVSSNRVVPGASAQLKVAVDTTGRSGFMAKHVSIHTNDRVQPTVSVTVLLTVRQAAGAAPK